MRDGQDQIDTYEEALLGLNETVVANHESNQRQFAVVNEKLDAIIEHLKVPYKPQAGFLKE